MLRNGDVFDVMKTLENQCQFLIKEMRKYLKKQLYRKAVDRTQRLISENCNRLSEICASIMLELMFLESKAVIKLLSKNIYRKYFYPEITIKKLLKVLNRNNSTCNAILLTKIEQKRVLQDEPYRLKTFELRQQCNLFKYDILRKDFIKIAKRFSQIYLTSVLYQFANFRNYNFEIEKYKKSYQLLENLTHLGPNFFSFKTQTSLIAIKLTLCKILFEKNHYSPCLKILNRIIQMLLNLHFKIRLWFQKKEKSQLQPLEPQEKYKTLRKKNHYIKNVLKYLIISIVMMIRINMKCEFEDIAVEGINIFNFILEKSKENQFGNLKKYLMPEIYIYQQFCRYRAEKFQIQEIIEPLFAGMIQEMKTNLKSTKQLDVENKCSTKPNMYNFYNEKMIQFREKLQRLSKKQQQIKRTANKKIMQLSYHINTPSCQIEEIHSTKKIRPDSSKSKLLAKARHPLTSNLLHTDDKSVSSKLGQTRESEDYLNLEKDIIDDIQISNRAYFTTRKQLKSKSNRWDNNMNCSNNEEKNHENEVNNNDNKLIQSKDCSLKIVSRLVYNLFNTTSKKHLNNNGTTSKQIIKNKKKLVRSGLVKNQDYDKSIDIVARTQKLQSMKSEMLNDLKSNIELLKQKKSNKTSLIMRYSDTQDMLLKSKNNTDYISYSMILEKYDHLVENGKQVQECKNSQVMNLNVNYKDKLKHLNKKTKLQMFIEVLIKHKEHFGIKKWSEKAQYIKKKHQLKQKFRSTRRTSSINVNGFKKLSPKMGFIAGNLILNSLQEIQEINLNSPQNYKKKQGAFDNQNNYKLGMKSIQILMNSLEKEKQGYHQNNEKQQKMSRTTRTVRKNTQKIKQKSSLYHSVGKLNHRNNWMCKFAQ